jgi:N-methylhydantoinase B
MTAPATTDVVTTEIIRNFFQSCAEDMNAALIRSAYSPVIYESKDCSVALLDPDANVLGQSSGLPIFLGALEVPVKYTLERIGLAGFAPGDVYFTNDPYITGAHINDVTVFAPVFWQDTLVGFTVSRAHWMDLGAKDPGVTMNSIDVYQEGLRAAPTKLFEGYRPREEWLDLLKRNSRFPDTLVGDLNAQVTACHTGENRFRAALDRFGAEFYAAVRDAAANEVLAAVSAGLAKRARFYFATVSESLGRGWVETHEHLFDAVQRKDGDLAERISREHIEETGHAVERLLAAPTR